MSLTLFLSMRLVGELVSADVVLDWSAPPGCPDEKDVRAWVGALVPPEARGRARARVEVDAREYRLVLSVTTAHGSMERSLGATRCDALARAAAVVIAVAIDPVETAARSSVPPPPEPLAPLPPFEGPPARLEAAPALEPGAAVEAAAAVEVAPAREAVRAPARRPEALVFGAASGAGLGLLPRPHTFAHAWVGPRWPHAEAHVIVLHRFARVAERPTGGGATISLSSGGVRAGPVVRRPWGAARVLGGLEAGVMVAVGRDLDVTRTAVSPWLGLALQPGVSWIPAPWVAVWADLTVTGSVLRPHFATDDDQSLHQTPLLGARVALGLEFRVPVDQSRRRRRPTR